LEIVGMLENEPTNGAESAENEPAGGADGTETTARRTTRRRSAATPDGTAEKPRRTSRASKAAAEASDDDGDTEAAPRRTRRRAVKAAVPVESDTTEADEDDDVAEDESAEDETVEEPEPEPEPEREVRTRTRTRRAAATFSAAPTGTEPAAERDTEAEAAPSAAPRRAAPVAAIFVAPQAPDPSAAARTEPRGRQLADEDADASAPATRDRWSAPAAEASDDEGEGEAPVRSRRRTRRGAAAAAEEAEPVAEVTEETAAEDEDEEDDEEDAGESAAARRRRRRGRRGRGRGKGPHEDGAEEEADAEAGEAAAEDDDEHEASDDGMTRRRRRRRRRGSGGGDDDSGTEDGVVTVVKIREPRTARDEVQGVTGSTRLEAKRQRRRDGRDQRRTRPSILSESEFLARREAVDRVMAIREKGDRTQIAVLEDGVLVEHYVTRATSGSLVGNVYLGKVQNVLPSMEAAFVDIGRGRNAVLYAGEVNWDMAGLEGRARSIEQALRSGDSVLVQVTKDPIGHKGARLTSHVALSGRHLVYVPNGNASGISRKLSDVERKRLRDILKKLVPEGAGVIVRTAAEGATEDELERDVKRLSAQWEAIESKVAAGGAPVQLYEEPDLVIRVVRDLFNEDFRELVVQGSGAYEMVENYLNHVSPDLVSRLRRHTGVNDVFAVHRIDEQIMKGLDRKVFLPSGGSLVIDRTEAMTVIDVNTGKYTGTGGNLEETVTRNNLEAAEEIVRQLRLRDLGGIIVIDFIDMVLESNRELVLRRLTECLGRDRTKHQVTEITSLGLVQMTRKRIGQGLLEAFSETCEHCKGRGVLLHMEPVPEKKSGTDARGVAEPQPAAEPTGRRRGRRSRGGSSPVDDAVDEVVDEIADDIAEDMTDEVAEDIADDDIEVIEVEPEAAEEPMRAAPTGSVSTNGPVTTSWTPPVTKSWVNLGAEPPAPSPAPEPAAQEPLVDLSQLSSPEVEALESESDTTSGRRRRTSRWRLRP
jgi:ribonuclease E